MSLQKKIVLLFLTLGVVFAIGSYAGLRTFVMPAFTDFEADSATENLDRVRRALDTEMHSVEVINREYSEWDHTHDYVMGRREGYAEENLDIAYWTNIEINAMLFFDLSNELIWGTIVDQSIVNTLPIEDELPQPLAVDHPLLGHADPGSKRTGILAARTAPMLVSSLPILRSTGEGPVAGTLVIGRFLDPDLVARLGKRAGVEALLRPFDNGDDASGDTRWIYSDTFVTGHAVIYDVFGKPAFVLEVSTPRTVANIARDTIYTTLVFFVAATVLFLLGGWIFTRRLIVSPVGALTRHIAEIRSTGDLGNLPESTRADEIGLLQQEFSGLAKKLGKAQRELESARDQALAVSNAKTDFLAKMSHEIRTPMNGVLGMIELLASTPLDRVQKRYIHSIRDSSDTLLDIISDILDFSKIEAGKLTLESRSFCLNSFVSDVADSLSGLAENKGLRLNKVLPNGPSVDVEADPVRLRQVLTNLLGNAIKFTERGSVLLRVSSEEESGEYERFTFEVIDTGIGVAARKQRQIFESFAQEDGSTTRRFGGAGLGLAISKQLVEMMGGEIGLDSEPGNGSRFWFTLRLRADRDGNMTGIERTFTHKYGELDAANNSLQPLRGRVLVAEDNAVNQAVAVGMLEAMGVESLVVADGGEAVKAFNDTPFDAILMDCQMPVIDGFEATAEIREIESRSDKKPVRIIAITANALAGDMEKCIAAGMDDYLRKPYKGEQLHAALAKVLQAGEKENRGGGTDREPSSVVDVAVVADVGSIDTSVLDSLASLPHAGDQDLVNQVIETYLKSSLDLMTRLGEAIDRADAACIRSAAHSLKSSSANVGATKLAELCASIETSTRTSDRASAVTLRRQIREEYTRVIKALKRRIAAAA